MRATSSTSACLSSSTRPHASTTGGQYFRATSGNVLSNIFKEIDQLEKTHMDVQRFTHTEDHYEPWALLLLGLMLLSLLLDYTLLRHIP